MKPKGLPDACLPTCINKSLISELEIEISPPMLYHNNSHASMQLQAHMIVSNKLYLRFERLKFICK